MVRVIYLVDIADDTERKRLISDTMAGNKWKIKTANSKFRDVTDREMVDVAQKLHGWTQSVYKFGCAFIHLSNHHNHEQSDPFASLVDQEKQDILQHMRCYHGGPTSNNPSIQEISMYIPMIFEKISANLERHIQDLESKL